MGGSITRTEAQVSGNGAISDAHLIPKWLHFARALGTFVALEGPNLDFGFTETRQRFELLVRSPCGYKDGNIIPPDCTGEL